MAVESRIMKNLFYDMNIFIKFSKSCLEVKINFSKEEEGEDISSEKEDEKEEEKEKEKEGEDDDEDGIFIFTGNFRYRTIKFQKS